MCAFRSPAGIEARYSLRNYGQHMCSHNTSIVLGYIYYATSVLQLYISIGLKQPSQVVAICFDFP